MTKTITFYTQIVTWNLICVIKWFQLSLMKKDRNASQFFLKKNFSLSLHTFYDLVICHKLLNMKLKVYVNVNVPIATYIMFWNFVEKSDWRTYVIHATSYYFFMEKRVASEKIKDQTCIFSCSSWWNWPHFFCWCVSNNALEYHIFQGRSSEKISLALQDLFKFVVAENYYWMRPCLLVQHNVCRKYLNFGGW